MGNSAPERDGEGGDLTRHIDEIYAAFARYEEGIVVPLFEKPTLKHPQSWSILSRYVLAPLLVFGLYAVVVLWVGWPLDYIKMAFLLLLLLWYVSLPSVQLMELYADRKELYQFLKNSNQLVISGLRQSVPEDLKLMQALKNRPVDALQLALDRISAQQGTIDRRVGALAGALDKIGIVPGLITLIIAASSKQNEQVTFFVAVVAFVVYLSAFIIHYSLPRLGLYTKLLESEIERSKK
nr:hypothetical protein [Oceanococcus sp. HetDA_MAG_MS8]